MVNLILMIHQTLLGVIHECAVFNLVYIKIFLS
jgi:hypothetical protein